MSKILYDTASTLFVDKLNKHNVYDVASFKIQ